MTQDSQTDHKFAQRRRRHRGRTEIEKLIDIGYEVVEITPYQYRVDGTLGLYPTGQKWHNLSTAEYASAIEICREQIP